MCFYLYLSSSSCWDGKWHLALLHEIGVLWTAKRALLGELIHCSLLHSHLSEKRVFGLSLEAVVVKISGWEGRERNSHAIPQSSTTHLLMQAHSKM